MFKYASITSQSIDKSANNKLVETNLIKNSDRRNEESASIIVIVLELEDKQRKRT